MMPRILVIDDDTLTRNTLRQILADQGHEVVVAEDGHKGYELCQQTRFDLVLTDIIMPEKEGLETIRDLRAKTTDLKIIAMSGGGRMAKDNVLGMARFFGADEILPKPFDEAELLEKLTRCLESPEERNR